jgi:hypothetical protein
VDAGVYTAGKSKPQQVNAKKFLEEIGVREVGEADQVEAILKKRYTRDNFKPKKQELKRFIALVEMEPNRAKLFADYFIFEGEDGKWHQPGSIFLDQPYMDTGLSAYYDAIGGEAKRYALSESYRRYGISARNIAKFAESVGAQTRLEITSTNCQANPQRAYLHSVLGDRYTSPIDRDYTISGIGKLLANPTLALSKLIWRTLVSLPTHPNYLLATYRKNERWGARHADSQFVHHLRDAAWVPQRNGSFVRPAEASRDLLPEGFPFDQGWPWLKAIHFGQVAVSQLESQQQKQALAATLGFTDAECMDRAKRFAALPVDEQRRILAEWETPFELTDHEPANPTRRAERVAAQAANAPERITEERRRSISINRDAVKQEAGQYLLQQYTNADGHMICQACKKRLPFQLDNGTDYFERVELLTTLKRHHKQNYVALCPNHAAMFQYANGSTEKLRDLLIDLVGNFLPVVLAKEETRIYFTKTHLADLKAIIGADEGDAEETGDEANDDIEPAYPVESGDLSGRTKIAAQR